MAAGTQLVDASGIVEHRVSSHQCCCPTPAVPSERRVNLNAADPVGVGHRRSDGPLSRFRVPVASTGGVRRPAGFGGSTRPQRRDGQRRAARPQTSRRREAFRRGAGRRGPGRSSAGPRPRASSPSRSPPAPSASRRRATIRPVRTVAQGPDSKRAWRPRGRHRAERHLAALLGAGSHEQARVPRCPSIGEAERFDRERAPAGRYALTSGTASGLLHAAACGHPRVHGHVGGPR